MDLFSDFHPWVLILLSGSLGSITAVIHYMWVNRTGFREGIPLFLLGMVSAIIAGVLEQLPGNTDLFLAALLASLAGPSIIGQYIGQHQRNQVIVAAAEDQVASLESFQHIYGTFQALQVYIGTKPDPVDAIEEIASALETLKQQVHDLENTLV